MVRARLSLKLGDQDLQQIRLRLQSFHHHSRSREVTEATQVISSRDMVFMVARLAPNTLVLVELPVIKLLDKATKTANMAVTKDLEAITMVIASNVAADGVATMDINGFTTK